MNPFSLKERLKKQLKIKPVSFCKVEVVVSTFGTQKAETVNLNEVR